MGVPVLPGGGCRMLEPMLFHLRPATTNAPAGTRAARFTNAGKHVGVLEFNAPDGCAVVPGWICAALGLTADGGDQVTVKRAPLPKGIGGCEYVDEMTDDEIEKVCADKRLIVARRFSTRHYPMCRELTPSPTCRFTLDIR